MILLVCSIVIVMKNQGSKPSSPASISEHRCIEQCNRQSSEPLEHVEIPLPAPKDEGFGDDFVVLDVDGAECDVGDSRCLGVDSKHSF